MYVYNMYVNYMHIMYAVTVFLSLGISLAYRI